MKPYVGQIVISKLDTLIVAGIVTTAHTDTVVDVIQFAPFQSHLSAYYTDIASPSSWYPPQPEVSQAVITTDQMLQLLIHTMNANSMILQDIVGAIKSVVSEIQTSDETPPSLAQSQAALAAEAAASIASGKGIPEGMSTDGITIKREPQGGVLFDGDKPPVQVHGPVTAVAAVVPEMMTAPANHLTQP